MIGSAIRKNSAWSLLTKWSFGFLVGTAIIAITSPLFVRSYLPRSLDRVRGVLVYPAGSAYRWRSEGYATTRIGLLGMPGRPGIESRSGSQKIALWGDSQAEGVAVADEKKLFAQIEKISQGGISAFPFARSGDRSADWIKQMGAVEQALGIDTHVVLLTDLSELVSDAAQMKPLAKPIGDLRIAVTLPAFVIHAARNILTGVDGTNPRRLRFSPGPVQRRAQVKPGSPKRDADWSKTIQALRAATVQPIVILYAPILPSITGGRLDLMDAAPDRYRALEQAAREYNINVVDLRGPFRESVMSGTWPHGFDNGYIGSGHLNADGNRIIAKRLVAAFDM